MRTIEKKVYYCDFCKKHGLSKYWIVQHEKHCTMNPNRECRMPWCDVVDRETMLNKVLEYIDSIMEKQDWGDYYTANVDSIFIEELEKECSCPIDVFSVLRRATVLRSDENHSVGWEYNFKDRAKLQLQEHAAENTYY